MEAQPDAGKTKAGAGRRWDAGPGERRAWVGPAWAKNKAPGQGAGPALLDASPDSTVSSLALLLSVQSPAPNDHTP